MAWTSNRRQSFAFGLVAGFIAVALSGSTADYSLLFFPLAAVVVFAWATRRRDGPRDRDLREDERLGDAQTRRIASGVTLALGVAAGALLAVFISAVLFAVFG
jgi:O-antigen ligase